MSVEKLLEECEKELHCSTVESLNKYAVLKEPKLSNLLKIVRIYEEGLSFIISHTKLGPSTAEEACQTAFKIACERLEAARKAAEEA